MFQLRIQVFPVLRQWSEGCVTLQACLVETTQPPKISHMACYPF